MRLRRAHARSLWLLLEPCVCSHAFFGLPFACKEVRRELRGSLPVSFFWTKVHNLLISLLTRVCFFNSFLFSYRKGRNHRLFVRPAPLFSATPKPTSALPIPIASPLPRYYWKTAPVPPKANHIFFVVEVFVALVSVRRDPIVEVECIEGGSTGLLDLLISTP